MALAACIALLAAGIAPLRSALFDAYQRFMPRERASAPAIVVAIDDTSLDRRGQWPWPRNLVAQLVQRLQQAGAVVIGLDILFVEPDRAVAGADDALAEVLRGGKSVLAIVGLPEADRRFRAPPQTPPVRLQDVDALQIPAYRGHLQSIAEIDRAAAARGLINVESSRRTIASVNLLGRVGTLLVPGFAVEILRAAAGAPSLGVIGLGAGEAQIRLAEDLAIPVGADGGFRIHYGAQDAERLVSAEAVLSGQFAPEQFTGKLVLVGVMASGLHDSHPTPLGERIAGVELHAQVLEQVFDGRFLRRPAWLLGLEIALLAAGGLLCTFSMSRIHMGRYALLLAGIAAVLALTGVLAFRGGWVVDVATPGLGVLVVFGAVLVALLAEANRQRHALRETQARVEGELSAARRIQTGLLPVPREQFAAEARFQLEAVLEPATTVGGDFYDCFMVDAHRLFFVIADVSGKGLPASLFMALSKSLLKSIALRTGDDPGAILTRANREIARDNPESLFVTAFVGLLDTRIGSLAFSNAGHEAPLARRADGALEAVEHSGGPPLCVMQDFEYPTEYRRMEAGEWLCAVTDGVTEAMDRRLAAYGAQRLRELLAGLPADRSAGQVVAAVVEDVRRFVGGNDPSDDLTVLCVRWNGSGGFELGQPANTDDIAGLADLSDLDR